MNSTATITTEEVWSALAQILDPEFGLSITDMGLIYNVTVHDGEVQVAMTLTTPTCPAGGMMTSGVQSALANLPGVRSVKVDLVWEPVWNPQMLTEAARRHLDGLGPETEH